MNPDLLDFKKIHIDQSDKQETMDQKKQKKDSNSVYDNLKSSTQYTNITSFMQEIHDLNKELVKSKFDNYSIPYNSTDLSDFKPIQKKRISDNQLIKKISYSNFENDLFKVKPIAKLSNDNSSEKGSLNGKKENLNGSFDNYKLQKINSDTEANTPENDLLSNNLELNENNDNESNEDVNDKNINSARNNNDKVYYTKKLIDFDIKHNSQIASERFKKAIVKKLNYRRIPTENLFNE